MNTAITSDDIVSEPWRFVRGFESIAALPNLIDEPEVGQMKGFERRWLANWLSVYEQVLGG